VLTEWEERDARPIKPREVIELLDKIVERGRPVTADRTAALLGQLFEFGIHRAVVETTPVQLLVRGGVSRIPAEHAKNGREQVVPSRGSRDAVQRQPSRWKLFRK
jgi:hypothetical protein